MQKPHFRARVEVGHQCYHEEPRSGPPCIDWLERRGMLKYCAWSAIGGYWGTHYGCLLGMLLRACETACRSLEGFCSTEGFQSTQGKEVLAQLAGEPTAVVATEGL